MVVTFSRFDRVRMPYEANLPADDMTKDFSGEQFKKYRRFWNEDLKKTNMKKIMMPTKTIHISGIQAGKSPNDVKRAFQGAGLQVLLWHSLQYLSFTKSAMIDQSVCDQSDCPHRLWSALVLQ